jgi:hypothetical protein
MDDLGFGLWVTLVGMGLVFGLLIALWLLLSLALRFEARPPAGTDERPATGPEAFTDLERVAIRSTDGGPPPEPDLVAAIGVAVARHAESRRLQAAPAMRSYWPGSLLFASRWVSAGRTRQSQSWRRRPR